jgi:uncharacterized protein YutD
MSFRYKKKSTFKWQINASAVGKLIGAFWLKNESPKDAYKYQMEELAKTWKLNTERMPRFGVTPSTTIQHELKKRKKLHTTEELVKNSITPKMKTYVEKAIHCEVDQTRVIQNIEQAAKKEAESMSIKASDANVTASKHAEIAIKKKRKLVNTVIMKNYIKKDSGIKKTKLNGFFFTNKDEIKIYKKISNTKARLSNISEAQQLNWVLPSLVDEIKKEALEAEKKAQQSKQIAKQTSEKAIEKKEIANNIKKVVTQEIQTSRGQLRENEDLIKVQKKTPTIKRDSKARFLSIRGEPYSGFVIGFIDGFDPQQRKVIELKHRSRGLFKELRPYEKVQCFVYMKMCNVKRAVLIETFESEQMEHEIEWDERFWNKILRDLTLVVQKLNQIEQDESFRNIIIEKLI